MRQPLASARRAVPPGDVGSVGRRSGRSRCRRASIAAGTRLGQPQHWFLAPGWNNAWIRPPPLPRKLARDKSTGFTFDLTSPDGGWKDIARLRIQTTAAIDDGRLKVRFNNTPLEPTDDISEPYPNANPTMLGTAETLRAWTVPQKLLREGKNEVRVSLEAGTDVMIAMLDLAAGGEH
ncbi:MAG TPA: hypothetical protein VHZ24_04010 [Pirellulales bacterium]|nr:hypothetical protein [Pirellulales bacterium]